MAAASTDASSAATSSPATSKAQSPFLRNPLPLSSAQEGQVRDLYYKKVRSQCADEIKEFALCAKGRTITTSFYCRSQRFAMNSCMILHATQENEDLAREEWFTGIEERRLKKDNEYQATEKRRAEIIEMTKRQEEKERLLKEMEDNSKRAAQAKKGWWG